MQLEDSFDFQRPDDIRIKGHRIGIETILYNYIYRARTPEEIAEEYPSPTLEQVYATILYYLDNKEQIDHYMKDWIEYGRKMREEQERNLTPGIRRLRKIRAEMEAARRKALEEQMSQA